MDRWRTTDAYACAHLAFWVAEWRYPADFDLRLRSVCDALRYARHAYHSAILTCLLSERLHPLLELVLHQPSHQSDQYRLSRAALVRVRFELTTLYAWLGLPEPALTGARIMMRDLSQDQSKSYGMVGSKLRRTAHQILIFSPGDLEARRLLDEARELVGTPNDSADVHSTRAVIAIIHPDRHNLATVHEELLRREHDLRPFFSGDSSSVSPASMTLSNAIAGIWSLTLTAVSVGDTKTFRRAQEQLGILLRRGHKSHNYLSPPTVDGAWSRILIDAPHSPERDEAHGLLIFQQPPATLALVRALNECDRLLMQALA
jgi:hypothetical protein